MVYRFPILRRAADTGNCDSALHCSTPTFAATAGKSVGERATPSRRRPATMVTAVATSLLGARLLRRFAAALFQLCRFSRIRLSVASVQHAGSPRLRLSANIERDAEPSCQVSVLRQEQLFGLRALHRALFRSTPHMLPPVCGTA